MPYHKLLSVRYSLLIVIGAALVFAGCSDQQALTGPENNTGPQMSQHPDQDPAVTVTKQQLAEVRAANSSYQKLSNATDDGYQLFSPFVPGMGFHYLSGDVIDNGIDTDLDPKNPEILVYSDAAPENSTGPPNTIENNEALAAVEYAVPKTSDNPPSNAVNLFEGADASDWHVHPSTHELPLSDDWTVHGECHYVGGIGVFLAENPTGDFVFWSPPTGAFGNWSGTVDPDQCPTSDFPPLLIAHGKWWTLHAWIWLHNPEGTFHATNPRATL